MKTNIKIFIFSVSFLTAFFIGNSAKADCYDICASADDPDGCFASCSSQSYAQDSWTSSGSSSSTTAGHCDNDYSTSSCCEYNGGYWYNNTCNTDPIPAQSGGNTSEYGPVAPYTYSECKADGGDEAYCGSFAGAPTTAQNLSNMSAGTCKFNSDCGKGFSCYQQSCVDDATYQENVAWYSRTGNAATQIVTPGGSYFSGSSGSGSTSSATKTAIATTTKSIVLPNGATAPAGTTVFADGSGVSPSGTSYPAGSFSVPTSPSAALSSGLNLVSASNKSGSVAGANNYIAPKCGTSGTFTEIGGVCFPNNTGLSNASISLILANLFSWMMGLFTTLAVLAFVVSGVQYLMSAGDESLAKSAKSNATNAVLGIIIGLSGFIIIKAIAAALAGVGNF